MGRLQKYIRNENPSFLLEDYINLCESLEMTNEMAQDTFDAIKSVGKKMGFKVKKSKSLIDYFRGAEKGMEDLLRFATLYTMTDIRDSKSRNELVKDAKKVLKSVNKKDIIAMLIQLDKVSLGLTSHIRHIIQSVFGIELATVNYWYDDVEYIKKELRHIRKVLIRMGGTEKELKALDKFERSMEDILNV